MKLYILTSYSTGLNDPAVSFNYNELYQKMKKSYEVTLNGIAQTEDEKENTHLEDYRAVAVIHGDWIEWSITALELSLPHQSFECLRPSCETPLILVKTPEEAYEKIVKNYHEQELCIGEFLSTTEVGGLSLMSCLDLISQLYAEIEGDTLLRIEGDYHQI
jgi:hypothetical protein